MLDAKYKKLDNKNIDRNDKHQIVSYAYTLNAKKAGFVYPINEINNCKENTYIGKLNSKYNNADCEIHKYALKIPSNKEKEFLEKIYESEENLKKLIISV